MTTVLPVNSAALLILQQANPATTTEQQKSSSDNLLAIASGASNKVTVSKQPTQAQSKISQSIFSVNNVNISKMKLDLIDRTGKALGVDQVNYATRDEFVDAMKKALGRLKLDGGQAAVVGLEKELGLDKLGVSVDDVIDSAKDPYSNDKLTKALEKQAGNAAEKPEMTSKSLQPDDIGLYGVANL